MAYTKYINEDGTRVGCSVEGCDLGAKQKSMCLRHYNQSRRGTPLTPPSPNSVMLVDGVRVSCSVSDCGKPAYCKGLCRAHYSRSRRPASTLQPVKGHACTVEACGLPRVSVGLCERHYKMNKKYGVTDRPDYLKCPVTDCGRNMSHSSTICKRCNQFRWRYSLSPSRVIELFLPANYSCSNSACEVVTDLHLDHSHACCPDGKFATSHKKSCGDCVRGWLCRGCNFALGFLQENPRKIQGLLDFYLATERG